MGEQERLLEQARRLAAQYEGELARVTVERDQAQAALSAIRTLMLAFTDPLDPAGDVVGVEDVPLGDPWAEAPDGWAI